MTTTTSTASEPRITYRSDYRPTPFLIDSIDLEFQLDDSATVVRSTLKMRRNPDSTESDAPLVLHGEELKPIGVELDGTPLGEGEYEVGSETLTVHQLPGAFELRTTVEIDPAGNTALEGLYKTGANFCTQCEAEGFRKITWYLDRPDVMSKFTTYIEGDKDKYPVMLSNGNLVGSGELEGGRHWAKWEDPFKKPSYLFALVAGQLQCHADSFTTRSGRNVKLELYVEPQNIDKCEHAMASLKKAMKWDEDVYGLEYDLDQFMVVATDDFNMGAMENKGLNIFNSICVLAKPETATDDNYLRIEGVVAHEYFHNWTGNRVTCRDWFQLTLKEGLTVFRDQMFSGDMNSHAVERIDDVTGLRAVQFAEDAGPMAHSIRPESYIEMNNFYTSTVYEKGAEVVRMYHTLLGAEGFRKGMDLYFERHDGSAVTCDDFRAAMADANGADLTQFERWYQQGGTPVLEVETAHDAATKRYTVTLRQSCPPTPGQEEKLPFHMPVAVGLLDPQGESIPLHVEGESGGGETTRVLELKEAEQRFVFTDVPAEPVASILRGFSAPVLVHHDRPAEEYAFLMANDVDSFVRWDAGQQYATELLLEGIAAHQRGEAWSLPEIFIAAFAQTLEEEGLDRMLKAQALCLPAESWLAERMEVADPVAVHEVRKAARKQIAEALHGELLATYEANRIDGPYEFEQEAVGKRSLKNLALAYLSTLGREETTALCSKQFEGANNMTDSIAALSALASVKGPEREKALADFYERWHHDPLVLDKWFGVQAMADLPDVTARVEVLMKHQDFTLKNPNRARALIVSYSRMNPAVFHAEDGRGYRFLADAVIAMNALNPQIASRLVDPLLGWRRVGPVRQEKMRGELDRILATEKLSKDVFEKVSKSLA